MLPAQKWKHNVKWLAQYQKKNYYPSFMVNPLVLILRKKPESLTFWGALEEERKKNYAGKDERGKSIKVIKGRKVF